MVEHREHHGRGHDALRWRPPAVSGSLGLTRGDELSGRTADPLLVAWFPQLHRHRQWLSATSNSASPPMRANGSSAWASTPMAGLTKRGVVVDLVQRNAEVSIPFLVSSRGYGLLWNNPAVGRVELGATATRWVAEQRPPDRLLGHHRDAGTDRRPLRRGDRARPDAARVGGRVLAVQAPLPHPRGAAGGGKGVPPSGPATIGHRFRLLPLDPARRLALRAERVARPPEPWSRSSRPWVSASWCRCGPR